MWLIALPFIVISFIMLFFLKEKPNIIGLENNKKDQVILNKNEQFIN